MRETELVKRSIVMAARIGVHLFRNNSGVAYMGNATTLKDGSVLIKNPRRVKFGVASPGGSDTIGWRPITIRPEHVGRTIAQFTAVEFKSETGRVTTEQKAFLGIVNQCGGFGIIAMSEEALIGMLSEFV